MNDDDLRLRELLESATRSGSDIPRELDGEARKLRETWITLGDMLDGIRTADATSAPVKSINAAMRVRRNIGLSLALAASVVIALGSAILLQRRGANPTEPAKAQQIAAVNEADSAGLDWNDSLDSRIAAVSLAMSDAPADAESKFSSFEAVENGVEQIGDEMFNSAL